MQNLPLSLPNFKKGMEFIQFVMDFLPQNLKSRCTWIFIRNKSKHSSLILYSSLLFSHYSLLLLFSFPPPLKPYPISLLLLSLFFPPLLPPLPFCLLFFFSFPLFLFLSTLPNYLCHCPPTGCPMPPNSYHHHRRHHR